LATVTAYRPSPDAGEGGAALLDSGAGQVLATGVFDCFADAVFEIGSAPPALLVVAIYAYSLASLPASLACDSSPCAPPQLDAGAYYPGYGWTTTCTATELAGTPVTAHCRPLEPYGAADAGMDARPDTGSAEDASGGVDGDAADTTKSD
jgi:hypothetical protein